MTSRPIKALLFDLDDTLLINDIEAFLPHYYRALLTKMSGVCPPTIFLDALNAGTRAMWHNSGTNASNAEVFEQEFFLKLRTGGGVRASREEILALFDDFYQHEFEALRQYTAVDPHAREAVQLAFDRGYQVAVITQPIFPRAAILSRLRWAEVGAEEFPYHFISSYEVLNARKPQPRFFLSVLEHLGRAPEECLVIGDSQADMSAGELGIKTFWIDRGRTPGAAQIVSDARGNLSDLIDLMRTGGIDEL
ncbi:MAG: HAD-IA family hydrolase [Anaerolineae bacterium]|nr:HAD-IA family hydrolase [Anaerolineae bacterium]